jgi:hypothetical protein
VLRAVLSAVKLNVRCRRKTLMCRKP